MKILRFIFIHDFYFDLQQILKETEGFTFLELIEHCAKIGAIVPKTFAKSMNSLGCDCVDMIINPEFLRRWCDENSIDYKSKEDAIKQTISFYKPDFVYIERCNWLFLDLESRKRLKSEFPFIKALILWIGVPPYPNCEHDSEGYDIIFCITPKMKEIYSSYAKVAHCNRSGIDLILWKQTNLQHYKKKHLFTFAGTSGNSLENHSNRYRILKYLLKHTPIQAWLHEPDLSNLRFYDEDFYINLFKKPSEILIKEAFKEKYKEIKPLILGFCCGDSFHPISNFLDKKIPLKYLFPDKVFSPVYSDEYREILGSSQIVLNLHINAPEHGGNFRVFETMAVGSCLLSDRVEYMTDFLEPDKDIVGFTSAEEALEKFNYLKDRPGLCQEIGQRAQKKIFSKHTIYHRCEEIISHLNHYLKTYC